MYGMSCVTARWMRACPFKEPTIPPEVAEYEEPVNMEERVSDVTLARLNRDF